MPAGAKAAVLVFLAGRDHPEIYRGEISLECGFILPSKNFRVPVIFYVRECDNNWRRCHHVDRRWRPVEIPGNCDEQNIAVAIRLYVSSVKRKDFGKVLD